MNRWFFWVLTPVMLGAAYIFAFVVPTPPTLAGQVILYSLAVVLVLAALGLAKPTRFTWALRIVAFSVFLGCACYVIAEVNDWRAGEPFVGDGRRSDANLLNSLKALLVFGVPALRFVFAGRSSASVDVLVTDTERDDMRRNHEPKKDGRSSTQMTHLVIFRTAKFDVRAEDPNPINPIPGQSVLRWLRAELAKASYTVTEPSTEDWGWYVDVEGQGAHYLVGASGDGPPHDIEWIVQVHKHRSLKEKMLGQNKMAADDPLVGLIERIVRADPQISEVAVERDA